MPAIPVLIPDETLARLEEKAAHGADEALRMLMPAVSAIPTKKPPNADIEHAANRDR